jgi:hypothetical protein
MLCARRVSGIAFIGYAQIRKIGKTKTILGAINEKGVNRIAIK